MNIKTLYGSLLSGIIACTSATAFAGSVESDYKEVDYKQPGFSFQNSPFRVSVDLRGGYDDNVRSTKNNRIESGFVTLLGNVTADISNPRTQLSIGIGGGATYYFDTPGSDWDYDGRFTLQLVHRFTPRLTLNARSLLSYETQPDFSEQIGATRSDGQYLYTNSALGLTYQWSEKFQTVTGYSFVSVNYENDFDKRVNDRIENYFNQDFRFLITPVSTLIAQYRLGFVNFDFNTINDSISNYFLLGFEHTFSPKLNISALAGAEIRDSDTLGTKTSPYFEGGITYIYGLYSNVELTGRYGFENSNVGNARNNRFGPNENRTARVGLRLNHGFSAKLSLFGSAYYHNNNYEGFISYTDNIINLTGGLRYAINRNWTVETSYSYTNLWSDQGFRDYQKNRVNLGGRFSF